MAWQLLNRAFDEAPGLGPAAGSLAASSTGEMRMIGPNSGLDGNWVLGLAFCDARGDLDEELAKASERAPGNARVRYARALAAGSRGTPPTPSAKRASPATGGCPKPVSLAR